MVATMTQYPSPMLMLILVVTMGVMYKIIRYLTCREVKGIDGKMTKLDSRLTTVEGREAKCRETLHLDYVDRPSCKDNVARIEKSSDQVAAQVTNIHNELSKMNRELGTLNGELKRMNGDS